MTETMLNPPLTDEGHWTTRTPAEWQRVRSEDLVAAFRVDGNRCPRAVRHRVLRVLFDRARPVVGRRVGYHFFEEALQLVCLKLWLQLQEGPGGNDARGGPHVRFDASLAFDAVDAAKTLRSEERRSRPSGDGISRDARGPQAVPVQELAAAILDIVRSQIDDPIDGEIFEGLQDGATLEALADNTRLSMWKVAKRRNALFKRLRKVALLRRMYADFKEQVEARWTSPSAVAAGPPGAGPEDEVADDDHSEATMGLAGGESVDEGKSEGDGDGEAGGEHGAGDGDGRRKREDEP